MPLPLRSMVSAIVRSIRSRFRVGQPIHWKDPPAVYFIRKMWIVILVLGKSILRPMKLF